jgi:hypothetical protein
LNVASGAVSTDDVVVFDDGSTATVLSVLISVENILSDPGATDAELVTAASLSEAITLLVNPACESTAIGALLNYGIEVEFAKGCWAAYIPSPDDCVDCGGKVSDRGAELVHRGDPSGDILVPAFAKSGDASCSALGSTYLKVQDHRLEWQISNTGGETLTIDRITLYWPSELGDLRKIRLRNVTIFDHVIQPSAATLDSGWRGHEVDRQIEPGVTKKLKLEFGGARDSGNRERRSD